jgi:3-oxoacyl-[acyl-carrier protein] reductase
MTVKDSLKPTLSGQIAVVTGAGRGIGAAIATTLASLGAHIVLCGRNRATLDLTSRDIHNLGGQSTVLECDVTDLHSVESVAGKVKGMFNRVDVLVNNAGVGTLNSALHELPPDDWDRMINTNLRGVYYCIRAFAPLMIPYSRGHIINISSLAGKNALPRGAAYAASKWGLNGLTYSVAEELRGFNIRVSAICPGSVNTEFSAHPGKNAEKMLQASDIAHAVEMIVTQSPQSFVSELLLRPSQKP